MSQEIIVFVAILFFILAWWSFNIRRKKWLKSEGMPSELSMGSLFYSEKKISMHYPYRINGIVDQAYKLRNKKICVVDTKNRAIPKVYQSDIIQLSVYAAILRSRRWWGLLRGYETTSYGYIRFSSHRVFYKKVTLLSDRELAKFVQRAYELKNGTKPIKIQKSITFCAKCPYSSKCTYKTTK